MVQWHGELVALTEDLGSICRTRWWLQTPVTLVPGDGCPFCIILWCHVVSHGLAFYIILFLWYGYFAYMCVCAHIHAQPQRPDWNSYSRHNLLGFENKTNLSKHWSKSMPSHLQILTVAEKLPWRWAGRVSSPQLAVLILWRPHRKPTCPALHTSCF